MYKKSLFFLLFMTPLWFFAQEINQFDAQGKRHGLWQKRYDSGRIRYTGTFEHGIEVGEFLFYENKIVNNHPTIRKVFNHKINRATVEYFNIYGKKKSEGLMIGKNRVGEWKYYNSNGALILVENYKKNVLDGKRIVYYRNDSVAEISDYKNGKLNGISSRFSKKGIKLHEMTYKNGLLHGRAKFFEVNGNLKETGLYYKDYKVGNWDFYVNGQYMGFKEPNKKTKPLSDKAIMESIYSKNDTLKNTSKTQKIKTTKQKEIKFVYEKPIQNNDLKNIPPVKSEQKTYSKEEDEKFLNQIATTMDKKIAKLKSLKSKPSLTK